MENPGDDPLQWLRDSIPGEPGVDYPIFSAVEQTSFSCDDKVFGGKKLVNLFLHRLLETLIDFQRLTDWVIKWNCIIDSWSVKKR